MRKLLGISLVAVLVAAPMMASAATDESIKAVGTSESGLASTGTNVITAGKNKYYAGHVITADDMTAVPSAAYVKGAYNAAISAVNKVAEDAAIKAGVEQTIKNTQLTSSSSSTFSNGAITNGSVTGTVSSTLTGAKLSNKAITGTLTSDTVTGTVTSTFSGGSITGTVSGIPTAIALRTTWDSDTTANSTDAFVTGSKNVTGSATGTVTSTLSNAKVSNKAVTGTVTNDAVTGTVTSTLSDAALTSTAVTGTVTNDAVTGTVNSTFSGGTVTGGVTGTVNTTTTTTVKQSSVIYAEPAPAQQ